MEIIWLQTDATPYHLKRKEGGVDHMWIIAIPKTIEYSES